jgi:predicted porin
MNHNNTSTRRPSRIALAAMLATVAGGAAAQAAPTVEVFGLADLWVGRNQAPGGKAVAAVDSGKMTTSHLGFRGGEDLGGGLRAVFAIESFLRHDNGGAGRFDGDAFWARNAYVGLSGGFGQVTLGRNTTALFVQTLVYNAFGDSFGFSPAIRHYFTSGTVTGDTGWNNSLRYASPKLGDLTLTAMVAAGEGDGGRNTGLSAGWSSGAYGAGLAWQKVERGATVNDTTTWQFAGAAGVGDARITAQFGRVDDDTAGTQADILGLGVAYTVGAGRVLAQWGRIDRDAGADRRTLSVGYDHQLSKRTDVYVVAMRDRLDGTGSGTSAGIGIRHRF